MPTTCTIIQGDALTVLRTLPAASVHCCVTSPPYWGLRDYGVAGQLGLEPTPEAYVAVMVAVFAEVRRVLRDDGTLWLNLGDSYATTPTGTMTTSGPLGGGGFRTKRPMSTIGNGIKPKDLCGIPWRLAFALQADGWYLRQDIIWAKPNPMPESVTDRCTKAHEYVFLMSNSARYWYDQDAIAEDSVYGDQGGCASWQAGRTPRESRTRGSFNGKTNALPGREAFRAITQTRNRRSVWTVATHPCKLAHFATFPPDLIRPMIRAGCPQGGTVLDPFGGSGTTGQVAEEEGRSAVLIELNPAYVDMQRKRTAQSGLGL